MGVDLYGTWSGRTGISVDNTSFLGVFLLGNSMPQYWTSGVDARSAKGKIVIRVK
ncbi:hypothetical protein BRE01_05270 [Brevibacillus reuszeri]|uniref:Uncharacterized protein n=1 Tax=Brevibacillus reuszeri TaxID=54915 RepID=A0ABQ0TFY9_9BACL|nr:hypothetical protein BRE01_05270 [Brevibacillus reuszeri]